jgi:uncharacterized protein (DUF362 family)
MDRNDEKTTSLPSSCCSRRTLLTGAAIAGASLSIPPLYRSIASRASVFVARGQQYSHDLTRTIVDGLIATGFDPATVRGKRVLLKPNLVEPTSSAPHMTTHPSIVAAVARAFRNWRAEVLVGEAPGHVRDTEMALVEGRLRDLLDQEQIPFADLNYEDVAWVPNRGKSSQLKGFYFPRSVVTADLIVSLPKMKTHHWVGVTASLKNHYGTIPGIRYGWPKNVLHYNGIPETVYDINASLPKCIAIVDGIECMEGDGPIMGTRKHMGVLVAGTNCTSVDATVARLMQLDPHRVGYLKLAENRLGPIRASRIDQRGEPWRPLAQPFELVDRPDLKRLQCS